MRWKWAASGLVWLTRESESFRFQNRPFGANPHDLSTRALAPCPTAPASMSVTALAMNAEKEARKGRGVALSGPVAEGGGFEPPIRDRRITVFKTASFGRSDNPPALAPHARATCHSGTLADPLPKTAVQFARPGEKDTRDEVDNEGRKEPGGGKKGVRPAPPTAGSRARRPGRRRRHGVPWRRRTRECRGGNWP